MSNPKGSKKKPGVTVLMDGASGENNPFSITSDGCEAPLLAGGKCTIGVEFAPTAPVSSSGNLEIMDNANGNPQKVGLAGKGKAVK